MIVRLELERSRKSNCLTFRRLYLRFFVFPEERTLCEVKHVAAYRITGYDRALAELRCMAAELGTDVREHLGRALEALRSEIHDNWQTRDEVIDSARDRIVSHCFNIMGLQQLRDQELRWILGYQRIAQELERIADYACDVAELCELRSDWVCPDEIWNMAVQLRTMFDYALANLSEDQENVIDLDAQDERLDQIYAGLQQELVRTSKDNKVNQELGFKLILARTLERMGDHVVNVGQEHLFVQTGQRRLAVPMLNAMQAEGVEGR